MKRRRTDYLVVHVSATPASRNIGLREVTAMHKRRGWAHCGYRYVIRRNGKVEASPGGDNLRTNHVRGYNSISLGVCVVGGVKRDGRTPENNMTNEQERALATLLKKLQHKYSKATICGHRDLSPDRDGDGIIEPHEHLKACPCFDAIPWAKSRGLRAANIRGVWDRSAPLPQPAPDARAVYLQKLLRMAGYEFGPVDGLIGPKTTAALKRYQTASGLTVTGKFDTQTVNLLRQTFEASRPAVEKPVMTPQMATLLDEVETSPMGSKTNMAAAAMAASTTLAAGKQIATDTADIINILGFGALILVALGGGGYLVYSRFFKKSRKATAARRSYEEGFL